MVNRVAIFMLLGCLLLDGSDAVSFSSKLVHRFSDEAKERWISKSGNVSVADSWPKKNSVEYLELLLSNDWKRQNTRVKLQSNNNSSRNQLLFPSEGSQTHFFGNQFYWLHYTWIDIGTPNVSFLVALDAGSNLLWVPCQCIQCAPLSASYYTSLDRNLSEYDPSSSSSSKNVSCSHHLCKSRSSCKSLKDPCPYIADYSTEDTSSSGYLVDDILHLASFSKHAPQSSVQSSVIIGCGRKQTGSYLDGAAPDGVMGLGLGDVSVPSLLAKAGLIQNSFSICFDENDSGSVFFGDQGPATQQSTSFLPIGEKYDAYFVGVESYCIGNSCLTQSGFQALVDSGASFTFLPTEIYAEVVVKFDKLVSSKRISLQGNSWKYCYNASSEEMLKVPDMRLIFSKNQSFVVRNHIFSFPENEVGDHACFSYFTLEYNFTAKPIHVWLLYSSLLLGCCVQGFTVFCLTVMSTDGDYGIIGQNFMMGHRMVFDRENLKLAWSHSKCEEVIDKSHVHLVPPPAGQSPNPLPTTEQQSTSNGQAAAPPSTAKTAPSKSIAASAQQLDSVLRVACSLLVLMCLLLSSD
ncbi:hypothetical protein WN944_008086 [Citrus x changshan-huyou]|uniref:Peptidase A1 domain-containing protein n=2 Tax=Citrus TaxID=2706 RepID=A0AAP0MM98_9ROSI